MAVAVTQKALEEGTKLFDDGDKYVYDTELQATYRRFVMDIAYIISDLMMLVTEEGKSGECMHCLLHAKRFCCIECSIECLLLYVCTLLC